MTRRFLVFLCVAACAGEQIPPRDDTDDDNGISCAPEIAITMRYAGRVVRSGAPVSGATVQLLDVAPPAEDPYDFVTTDASGSFDLVVDDLPWFPDCHLVWTDYEIHVDAEGDTLIDDVNFETFVAYDDGEDQVDLGDLELEPE